MRITIRLAIAIGAAAASFVLGFLAAFSTYLALFSPSYFNGDAGAKFGVLGMSVLVGLIFSLTGFIVGARLSLRIPLNTADSQGQSELPIQ
jgi:hypothetical protein